MIFPSGPMVLNERVAIVTGSGRGIGKSIALRLARDGAGVVVAGLEPEALRETTSEIDRLGRRQLHVHTDVSRPDQVDALIEQTLQAFGRIDILVNNAAIIGPTAPVDQIELRDWEEVLAVNLTGAFLCCRAVLPAMKAQRSGKIINIASVAGKMAYALRSPYAVSKWGLIGLTMTLAKEVGEYQIQVNAVCPGPVEGDRMRLIVAQRARELGQDPGQVERGFVETTVLKRMVRAEDVADLVAFLASPSADNITGQAIDVSAGYSL
jgi:meso-butanediol dehydrogenase / (S,S)-butanediol dehydrogenase / diacetyl reductase